MSDADDPEDRGVQQILSHFLSAWNLVADGRPVTTPSSVLLPVLRDGAPAMLKIATHGEEKRGAALMVWCGGDGAARVLAHDGPALLMERAEDGPSLLPSRGHTDDEAIEIMCAVIARPHRPRPAPRPALVPLSRWFRNLLCERVTGCPVVALAAETARDLLSVRSESTVLHGDIHHGNVLHFGRRGWLAIDPKGLIGHRAFDYANMFCNPDHEIVTDAERFRRRLEIVSRAADLEKPVLLKWILAWAGLSATWMIESDLSPKTPLAVAELAADALIRAPH